jgi:SpoVK/Ycf46/Vps4 family AAA+-type ATPase
MSERIDGLRDALAQEPENHSLRLLLAEELEREGRAGEALEQYVVLLELGQLHDQSYVHVGRLALQAGRLDLAQRLAQAAQDAGVDAHDLVTAIESARDEGLEKVRVGPPDESEGRVPLSFEERLIFADVGGLDDVKKTVERLIILPFNRPELYERYGRRAGGGILLFGPPGVGKTMIARAVAGECDLPFLNVRIEEILDPWFGVSEQNLHAAFEQARTVAPCVLFLDELDALAFTRRRHMSSTGRSLVDQLLQELDAIGSDNENLLVLAATNAPWDVDEALKRPGRFDRDVFVPPPDARARERILELHLEGRGSQKVDVRRIAERTALFSGADLRELVNRAVDLVIDEALDTGGEPPLATAHLVQAMRGMRPSTLEWLATARNFVDFANRTGAYDDVAQFLKSADVKAWRV